jgi:hypothetical protein
VHPDFVTAGQSAEQPADTIPVQGVAPGDRATGSSTAKTASPKSDHVSAPVSEQLVSDSTGDVAARRRGRTLDQPDPFADADLGSF